MLFPWRKHPHEALWSTLVFANIAWALLNMPGFERFWGGVLAWIATLGMR